MLRINRSKNLTTKAAVGPVTCTGDPPKNAATAPPTIAGVKSGLRWRADGDGQRDAERQRDDTDDDAGREGPRVTSSGWYFFRYCHATGR